MNYQAAAQQGARGHTVARKQRAPPSVPPTPGSARAAGAAGLQSSAEDLIQEVDNRLNVRQLKTSKVQ
jgi:hypothetical protein